MITTIEKTTWRKRKVKRFARLNYGNNLPDESRLNGDIEVFGSNGIVGNHNKSNTNGPTIIIGRKGSAGKLILSKSSCFVIDTAFYIDKDLIYCDLNWLFFALKTLGLTNLDSESPVPGLSREQVYQSSLYIPAIDIQKSIGQYLQLACKKIDQTVQLKQQQIISSSHP